MPRAALCTAGVCLAVSALCVCATAQNSEQLQFVVYLSRHGVRSPTGKTEQLNRYSAAPWPTWSVPSGYLTAHGYRLMENFGAFDRVQLAREGLFDATGCGDAAKISIYADSDQRTRESGKALAAGLAPECGIKVSALPEGTADPLFHPLEASVGRPDRSLALAAVSGRIGANPGGLVAAYRSQFDALDEVLRACSPGTECKSSSSENPVPLFKIPASIGPGKTDHLVELRTPLSVASTMAENLLLEYTEGLKKEEVGWGRVDADKLRELLELHTSQEDIVQRTPYIARAQSSNILSHVLQSMEQAAEGRAVSGALSRPGDRLLILVGHDTNIANISGALCLSWLIDGRRDDTPPGGALVFELWKRSGGQDYVVRVYYTAQTLDQMRNEAPLSLTNPPERVPVFVPECGQSDGACEWSSFQKAVTAAIDPGFVTADPPRRSETRGLTSADLLKHLDPGIANRVGP